VNRMGGWEPVATVKKDGRWTVEELADNKSELFGADGSGGKIPPMTF